MATITQKYAGKPTTRIQVFAHHGTDANLPDAVQWSAGDIIDVAGSIGKPASKVKFILRGSITIYIKFNDVFSVPRQNRTGLDTYEDMSTRSNVATLKLLNSSGTQEFNFDGYNIETITIVDPGTPSTSNYVEIIVAP